MQLGTRLGCVGSFSRVSGACQDSAREFAGRRPRLTRRLSRVAEKLAQSWKAYREFARTTSKVSGRSLGIRWEIAGGRS
ncbi:hypothetical protein GW17_00049225 [Ensete ventricosum]|nr:hypothetical protein GW17_00049225 [Ensete ventricosum]